VTGYPETSAAGRGSAEGAGKKKGWKLSRFRTGGKPAAGRFDSGPAQY